MVDAGFDPPVTTALARLIQGELPWRNGSRSFAPPCRRRRAGACPGDGGSGSGCGGGYDERPTIALMEDGSGPIAADIVRPVNLLPQLIEFPADDPERARRFWSGLLEVALDERAETEGSGWQTHTGETNVGVHARGTGPGDTVSLPYFTVPDMDAALEQVRALGGERDPSRIAVGDLPGLREARSVWPPPWCDGSVTAGA